MTFKHCPKWGLDVDEEFNCFPCEFYEEVEWHGITLRYCCWEEHNKEEKKND
jgi:hypothetical protein